MSNIIQLNEHYCNTLAFIDKSKLDVMQVDGIMFWSVRRGLARTKTLSAMHMSCGQNRFTKDTGI